MSHIIDKIKQHRSKLVNKSGESTSNINAQSQTEGDSRLHRSQCITNTPIVAGTFTLLIIFALGLFINVGSTSAITVSIDNSNLTLNLPTKSSAGDFVESGSATITVNSDSGYTLSIASSSDNTDLTSGSNKITSISSSLSKSDFSATSNTDYNNKWGYKPSQYVTVDGEDKTVVGNTGDNSVFKPLPGKDGEMIDYKDSSSGDNTYTLSIGARASINTPLGEYQSDTFIIAAVGNVATDNLIINYDANGGYFGSDTSKTVNSVAYDATAVEGTVTKYSYTPNLNDAGEQLSNYAQNLNLNEVVTISGASTIHVKFVYGGEDIQYDWATLWAGSHPDYAAEDNYSLAISCGGVTGGKYGGNTKQTVECDIEGDSVTFGFASDDYDDGIYYGYYAVVTGEGTAYSKTVTSGTYATPVLNTAGYYSFLGWSTDKDATTPTYITETEISSDLQAVNGDTPIILYAIWEKSSCSSIVPEVTYMQDIVNNKSAALNVMIEDVEYVLKDKRDGKLYCVAKLQDGNIWMTQNLDLDLNSAKRLRHADTDLGWGTDTATTTWTPAMDTIDATRGAISGWVADQYAPYSVNPGDWYWKGKTFYDSSECSNNACRYIDKSGAKYATYFSEESSDDTNGSHGHIGNYYNWSAAVASDSTAGVLTGVRQNSICPAGWKLPQDGLYRTVNTKYNSGATNTSQNLEASPLFLVRGGFINSSLGSSGFSGGYWTNTVYNGAYAYNLSFNSSSVNPSDSYGYRSYGKFVRCLVR